MVSKVDKQRAEELVAEANQKFASGDFGSAISLLDEAITLDPNNADAWNNRGSAKYELDEFEEAIKDLDEAIRLNPKNDDAWNNRGSAKNRLEQHAEAIKDLDEAIALDPKNDEAWRNRGGAKNDLKQHAEAIKDFDEAIRLNPKNDEAWNNRGSAKGSLGQYEEAIKDHDEAIRINAENASAWNNRGAAKIRLKQYTKAVKDLDEAIRLNPEYDSALNNRGTAQAYLEQFEEAIKDIEEAVRLTPNNANAINNLAAIRAEKNAREAVEKRLRSVKADTEYLQEQVERYEDEHKQERKGIRILMSALFIFIALCIGTLILSATRFNQDNVPAFFKIDDPLDFIPWLIMIALLNSPIVWAVRLIIQRANKAELMAAEYAHLRYIENQIFVYSATSGNDDGIKIRADYIKATMGYSPSDKLLAMNKGKSSTETNQTPHETIIKEIYKNLSGGNK